VEETDESFGEVEGIVISTGAQSLARRGSFALHPAALRGGKPQLLFW
jgi:hypothetical protein